MYLSRRRLLGTFALGAGASAGANIKIASGTLREMIDKTLYSVSSDETRYNLTGVYCEPLGAAQPGLRMVSTDGHRLSIVEDVAADGAG
jgi:DNA polymerase-3 subunit beta